MRSERKQACRSLLKPYLKSLLKLYGLFCRSLSREGEVPAYGWHIQNLTDSCWHALSLALPLWPAMALARPVCASPAHSLDLDPERVQGSTPGPSNPIPGSFLEPLVHSWSHFVGIHRQILSKSSNIDFWLRFEGPGVGP